MKRIFITLIALLSGLASLYSQVKADSSFQFSEPVRDSIIKEKLIFLAMQNPSIQNRDALVNASEYQYRKSKSAWLEAITLSGNVNEFVVNNSPNSSFFPKYNMGVALPLNLFGKSANEKKSAREMVRVAEAGKLEETRRVKKEVLVRYENYKEKKDIYDFNKRLSIGRRANYTTLQKAFAEGSLDRIEDLNKGNQEVIDQEITERSSKRDYLVAILELEELIGVELTTVFDAVNGKVNK